MIDLGAIDWIFFDIDGTLWDHDAAAARAVVELCGEADLPPEIFLPHFQEANRLMWQDRIRLNLAAAVVRVRRVEMALERSGLAARMAEAPALSARYLCLYTTQHAVLPGAAEAVTAATRHARVAAVTNGLPDTQEMKVAQLGPAAPHVQFLHCAAEVDSMKPHAHYFDAARALAGNPPPSRILMVGDSWAEDIATPRAMGWQTAWLARGRPTPPGANSATAIYCTIAELAAALERA